MRSWIRSCSVQFSHSVVSSSLWPHGVQHARPPCPSSTPGVYLTHVHWVGDAIQPSHPLWSPYLPTFNLPQHQGLFKWVSSAHQVAKVLEFQLQHQSFQWMNIQDWFPLRWNGWIFLQSKGLSRIFSNTTFIFWMLSFKPTFPLSSFTFIKRLFSSSSLSP